MRISWKWFAGYRSAGGCEKRRNGILLTLAADALADQLAKPTFAYVAELIVMVCFLADHEAPAVVTSVKPFGRGIRGPACAINSYPRAHLDKRASLRKLRRILVFHAHQRGPLIVLENVDRAYRNLISRFSLSDRPPLSGGQDERHHQEGREPYRDC